MKTKFSIKVVKSNNKDSYTIGFNICKENIWNNVVEYYIIFNLLKYSITIGKILE